MLNSCEIRPVIAFPRLFGALLLERCSRLKHRAVDIFMASSQGLVQELESLLDGGESHIPW